LFFLFWFLMSSIVLSIFLIDEYWGIVELEFRGSWTLVYQRSVTSRRINKRQVLHCYCFSFSLSFNFK
jgi:hypothetical protein